MNPPGKNLPQLPGAKHSSYLLTSNPRLQRLSVAQPQIAMAARAKRHLPFSPAGQTQVAPKTVQPKILNAAQTRTRPNAPPVYSPQPLPKVLQTKTAMTLPISVQPKIAKQPPAPVGLSQSRPAVLRPESYTKRVQLINDFVARASGNHRAIQRTQRQAFRAGIVQATKYYPNLHPGAAVPVDRSNIFSLDSFADQYRLHRVDSHGVNVPNLKYNFVRTREGTILLHNRYRHPSLAEGQQVLYAGEAYFNNGKLDWWSNGSGHYQPDADGAEQANLPMDYFYSYQQIMKGEHTRR